MKPVQCWIDTMQQLILDGCTLQDLFDVSEDVLGNWMLMADSLFRLMAYTRNIPIDDPLCMSIVEQGYHDQKTAEKLLLGHAFKPRDEETRKGYAWGDDALKYRAISRTFIHEERNVGHVLYVGNMTDITSYRIELFKLFCSHVEMRASILERQGKHSHTPKDELLDLLSSYGSSINMRKRSYLARTVGLLSDKTFVFGFVEYVQAAPDFLESAAQFFERTVSGCMASIKEHRLLVLVGSRSGNVLQNIVAAESMLVGYLEKHGARLYLSVPCSNIDDLPKAFRQAEMAERVSEGTESKWRASRVLMFDDAMTDWLVSDTDHDFDFMAYCIDQRPFGAIMRNESPEMRKMLRAYLEGERRATVVGKQVSVHRNSLLYQIRRIEREYNVSLDDFATRFELMFLFKLYDLYPNELDLSDKAK